MIEDGNAHHLFPFFRFPGFSNVDSSKMYTEEPGVVLSTAGLTPKLPCGLVDFIVACLVGR